MSYYPDPSLEGLPRELVNIIASKEPRIATKLALTSKTLREKTRITYERHRQEQCKKDLLLSEIKRYLSKKSHLIKRFGYMYPDEEPGVISFIFRFGKKGNYIVSMYEGTRLDTNTRGDFVFHPNIIFSAEQAINSIKETNHLAHRYGSIWMQPLIDIVSMFKIHKRRKECTLPVIRDKLVNVFDTYVKDYQEKRDALRTNLIFSYLIMNAYVLRLPLVDFLTEGGERGNPEVSPLVVDQYIPLIQEAVMRLE